MEFYQGPWFTNLNYQGPLLFLIAVKSIIGLGVINLG